MDGEGEREPLVLTAALGDIIHTSSLPHHTFSTMFLITSPIYSSPVVPPTTSVMEGQTGEDLQGSSGWGTWSAGAAGSTVQMTAPTLAHKNLKPLLDKGVYTYSTQISHTRNQ